MNSTQLLLLDSLKDEPIGKTDNFTWFISDIGIIALFNGNENLKLFNLNVEVEANKIDLDITKEVKEYMQVNDKRLFLFYS
tara:strand:- start:241 stop:483 length:243 start_codon:yes stop_codon:yes gene_type:complete